MSVTNDTHPATVILDAVALIRVRGHAQNGWFREATTDDIDQPDSERVCRICIQQAVGMVLGYPECLTELDSAVVHDTYCTPDQSGAGCVCSIVEDECGESGGCCAGDRYSGSSSVDGLGRRTDRMMADLLRPEYVRMYPTKGSVDTGKIVVDCNDELLSDRFLLVLEEGALAELDHRDACRRAVGLDREDGKV